MYWKRSLYYFSLSLSLLFLSIFIDCSVLAVFSFFSYLVVCAVCVLCICLYCLLVSSCNRAHAPIKYTRSLVKVCAHTLTELANFSSDRSEHEKKTRLTSQNDFKTKSCFTRMRFGCCIVHRRALSA